MFITFLSDFGLKDDFVGTCHGVMKRIAPEAQIIDITHGIPPQAILQGALVLANTIGFMPVGVHLAIVDPGVGGPRRPLALQDGEGRRLRRARTTACCCRRRVAAASRRHTSSRIRSTRSTRSRGRSTGATSSAPRRLISRSASRSPSSAHRSTRRVSSASICPSRILADGAIRDAPVRRQLRQHRAQPRPRRRRGARDRLGNARRARALRVSATTR